MLVSYQPLGKEINILRNKNFQQIESQNGIEKYIWQMLQFYVGAAVSMAELTFDLWLPVLTSNVHPFGL